MKILLGTNMNFGGFVWSPQETLRIVKEEFGLCHVEMTSDVATSVPLFLMDCEAFEKYHLQIGSYAKRIGVNIHTAFNFFRDSYSLTHSSKQFREIALNSCAAILLQAECYRKTGHPTEYAGSSFGSIYKEDYIQEDLREQLIKYAMSGWKGIMHEGARVGLAGVTMEIMSTLREPPSTISQTKRMLKEFDEYHDANRSSTVPIDLLYDTGHGVSREEGSEDDRRFVHWFKTFPSRIAEIHLKNTDKEFLSTWPFTSKYKKRGIIDELELVEAVKTYLKKREVYFMLELSGKKGREIGEKILLTDIAKSVKNVRKALKTAGFQEEGNDIWVDDSV